FRFTWPAFVLMLKSCGDKTTMGKPIREINSPVQPKVERTKLVGDTVALDEEPDTSKYYYGLYTVPVVKKEKKNPVAKTKFYRPSENICEQVLPVEIVTPPDTFVVPGTALHSPMDSEPLLTGAVVSGISVHRYNKRI